MRQSSFVKKSKKIKNNLILAIRRKMVPISKNKEQIDIQSFIMDRETYNKTDHRTPYVFSIQKDSHNLVYFGANHCFDIEDDQTTKIENLRKHFIENPNPKKHAFIEANI